MTGYEQFISNPQIEKGKISLLWELEINKEPDDMIDFIRDFLDIKGYKFTGSKHGIAIRINEI